MEAIILAGGLGTRLASRLVGVPKPMAPVAGRPFLEYLLQNLQAGGCSRVILSVGHLSSVIQQHFGNEFHGIPIAYVIEAEPLGTGGAIRTALAEAQEPDVLVLNGDTFLPIDYAAMFAFHAAQSPDITMAVSQQPDVARYGEVLLDGDRVTGFREKGRSGPGWINAGTYILPASLQWPAHLPEKFSFETDFMMPEVAKLQIAAFPSAGRFLDIGIPEDLDRAQTMLAS